MKHLNGVHHQFQNPYPRNNQQPIFKNDRPKIRFQKHLLQAILEIQSDQKERSENQDQKALLQN